MALSPRTTAALMQQETEDSDIVLMSITHDSWGDQVMRFSTHPTTLLGTDNNTGLPIYGTVSRGDEFIYAPVQVSLPSSADESPPEAHLIISNISRELSPYIKLVDKTPPKIKLEVVNTGTPDIVEMCFEDLDFDTTTWDASTIDLKVTNDIASKEPVPFLRFSLGYFQNMGE